MITHSTRVALRIQSRTLAAICGLALGSTALAVVVPVAPGVTVSIYDTGGQLNNTLNGNFFLGGLEVDPAGGRVFVMSANVPPGAASTSLRMIQSTGLGTAAFDASGPLALQYFTRGTDLTHSNGQYHVAARNLAAGQNGVYGVTPGVAGFASFAQGPGVPAWQTSGLTFNAAGTTARITSDVGIGHHSLLAGAVATTQLVMQGPLPNGYPVGADDHTVTPAGRVIVAGDSDRRLYDITGGAGAVAVFADVNLLLAPNNAGPGVGSRITVDPATNDLYFAFGQAGDRIVRVAADGLSAEIIAAGFSNGVRDIDFGLASDGSGAFNLYATEIAVTGIGTIYEFRIPGPGALGLFALAGLTAIRRRR